MRVMPPVFGRRAIVEDKPAGEPMPVKRASLQSVDLGPISPAAAAHIENLESSGSTQGDRLRAGTAEAARPG
jgi:hypothetical protein